jgi:Na+-transporting NADH:ubiquinone oxidoreductase subunit NqrE
MPSIIATEYAASGACGSNCFDGTYVWTAHQSGTTLALQQFNPSTGAELNSYTITLTGNATSSGMLIYFSGSLWYQEATAYLAQIDPATGLLLNEFLIDTTGTDTDIAGRGIDTDGTDLYVAYDARDVSMTGFSAACQMTTAGVINWTTKYTVTTEQAIGPVVDGSFLYVNDGNSGNVYQLNLSGSVTETIPVGANLGQMIASSSYLTVLATNGNLYQVNLSTFAVTGPFAIPSSHFPFNLVADPSGNIWVLDLSFSPFIFYVDVFSSSCTPIGSVTTNFTNTNAGTLCYDTVSSRVWTNGIDPSLVMLAMGFAAPRSSQQPVGFVVTA